jgi:hypothetical protein
MRALGTLASSNKAITPAFTMSMLAAIGSKPWMSTLKCVAGTTWPPSSVHVREDSEATRSTWQSSQAPQGYMTPSPNARRMRG